MLSYKELITTSLIGTGTNLKRKVELNLINQIKTELALPKDNCTIAFRRHLTPNGWLDLFSLDYPVHNIELTIEVSGVINHYIGIIDIERIGYEGRKIVEYISTTLNDSTPDCYLFELGRYILKLHPGESEATGATRAANQPF